MTAIELIAAERQRQIEEEGWTEEYDKEHVNGELALAAACYVMFESARNSNAFRLKSIWPWETAAWKPSPDDRIRELVKAGALIVAEIDRLRAFDTKEQVIAVWNRRDDNKRF